MKPDEEKLYVLVAKKSWGANIKESAPAPWKDLEPIYNEWVKTYEGVWDLILMITPYLA